MTANSAHRSRWRRFGRWAGGLLVLLILGMVAYTYRPLNAVERQLLGTWQLEDEDILVTYHADRTLSSPGAKGVVYTGSWSVRGDKLVTTTHVSSLPTWRDRLEWISQRYSLWLTGESVRIVELSETRLVLQYSYGTNCLADGYVRWNTEFDDQVTGQSRAKVTNTLDNRPCGMSGRI